MSEKMNGYFGEYGGQHVPEVIKPALKRVGFYQNKVKS